MLVVSILVGALSGLAAGNGIPHFIRGITRQRYPSVFGSAPATNLVLGWISLALATIGFVWVATAPHRIAAFVAAALGVLAIGLFHATIGAFGRTAASTKSETHDG